jgi:MerR family transcriptional regulator/heat shock protein HspR
MVTARARLRQSYALYAQDMVRGETNLVLAEEAGFRIDFPVFPVGQMARLAHVHPQTLREYDRIGLIRPQRTPGGARRYSLHDVDTLTRAEKLSSESIGIAGIRQILSLTEENRQLRRELRRLRQPGPSFFAADARGILREYPLARMGREGWRDSLYRQTMQLDAREARRQLRELEADSNGSVLELETRRAIRAQIEGSIVPPVRNDDTDGADSTDNIDSADDGAGADGDDTGDAAARTHHENRGDKNKKSGTY